VLPPGEYRGILTGIPAALPGELPRVVPLEVGFTASVRTRGDTTRIGFAFDEIIVGARRQLYARALYSEGDAVNFRLGNVLGWQDLECRLLLRSESGSLQGPCAPADFTGRALSIEILSPAVRQSDTR
jgi:hypothetical protein